MANAPALSSSADASPSSAASSSTLPLRQRVADVVESALNKRFLRTYLATPQGRAGLLRQLADAEGGDGGELDIFSHVLAVMDDEKLRSLVKQHHADEERHEQLFLARMRAQGVEIENTPKDLHLLHVLDERVGFFSTPVTTRRQVMEAYLLLLVIEERAIRHFDRMAQGFEDAGDHESARVLREVKADEVRHVRTCEAVSRRYADSEAERQEALSRLRQLERESFALVQRRNLRLRLEEGVFRGPARWFWRTLLAVAELRPGLAAA
jgi:rubrerythrin